MTRAKYYSQCKMDVVHFSPKVLFLFPDGKDALNTTPM